MPENHYDDKSQSFTPLVKDTLVGHYRIIDKIGAGGMGEVYLAEDTKLKRQVALKFLPPNQCQDEECRARFSREAQATAKLDHPNIVTIHEVSEYQGRPFLAMQYVSEISLKDYMAKSELSIPQIIDLMINLCNGLSAAHKADIIHRDLKPTNILISKSSTPKIVDFGLAQVAGVSKLTETGSTLGTLEYMSPEQVEGRKLDQRSDIFSLGIILYELITGRRPFTGEYAQAVQYSIIHDTPEPLARYKADVPDGLQQIIDRALDKNIETRYPSAAAMLADLKRLKSGTVQTMRRGKISIWPGAVIIAILIGLFFVISPWKNDSNLQEPNKLMLAVLPFENLGNPGDDYFADGITEEITSRLGMIRGLGVISRTSAMQYKHSKLSLPEIARELGVDYILEGTIRWDKSSETKLVRITPQLIEVSDNTHLWTAVYEEALTSIFAVQTSIATNIAKALDVTLNVSEQTNLAALPTENLEAYDAYLGGLELMRNQLDWSGEYLQLIQQRFERAVKLDSNFTLAYVRLSEAYGSMYNKDAGLGRNKTTEELTRFTAQRALDLSPNLPEAHISMAQYYYTCHRNYEMAIDEIEIALQLDPSNTRAMWMRAVIYKRKGKFGEAINLLNEALEFSPRDTWILHELTICYKWTRQYEKGIAVNNKLLAIDPDNSMALAVQADFYYLKNGDIDQALSILEEAPVTTSQSRRKIVGYLITKREFNKVLESYDQMYAGNDPFAIRQRTSGKAYIFWLLNEPDSAQIYCDSARIILEKEVKDFPKNYSTQADLGFCYAILGRNDDAVSHVDTALALIESDHIEQDFILILKTKILSIIGDHAGVINTIDNLLSRPSPWSATAVLIDPCFDSLHDNPEFQKIIEKYRL